MWAVRSRFSCDGAFRSSRVPAMTRLALVPVVVGFVIVLAGCGGSSKASPAEQWASGVCSSIDTWKTEISTITSDAADALKDPATAREGLKTAVDDGKSATQTLLDDLKGLQPPDTPEGQQAQQQLDTFVTSVQATADDVQQALNQIPDASSINAIVESLTGLSTEFQKTIDQGRELVTTLTDLGSEMKDAFQSASSCQDLTGS
jgi:hypothetical protein